MKRIIMMLIMIVLLLPMVTAWEWDNVKTYDAEKKEITITNALGLGGDLAKYKLTFNTDECLINCYAEGIAYLYDKQPLFQDMNMYRINRIPVDIPYKILYKKDYISIIKSPTFKEVCEDVKGNVSCHKELDKYVDVEIPASKMVEYKGEDLNGTVYWRVEVRKPKDLKVDWVATSNGRDLNDWAWFNSNWNYKRALNFTNPDNHNRSEGWIGTVNNLSITNCTEEVRITADDDTTEIPSYARHINSTACEVYFVLEMDDSEDSKVYYLYYNNSGASDPSYTTNMTFNGTFLVNQHYNQSYRASGGQNHNNHWNFFECSASYFNSNVTVTPYPGMDGGCWTMFLTTEEDTQSGTVMINDEVVVQIQIKESGGAYGYNATFFHDLPIWKLHDIAEENYGEGGIRVRFAEWGQNNKNMIYRTGNATYTRINGGAGIENLNVAGFMGYSRKGNGDSKEFIQVWKNKTSGASPTDTAILSGYLRQTDNTDPQGCYPSSTNAFDNPDGGSVNDSYYWIGYHMPDNEPPGIRGAGANESREDLFLGLWFAPVLTVGAEESETSAVTVTLNTPADNLETAGSNITFNCSANDDILNLTLIINDVDNETIYNTTADQNLSIESSLNFADGTGNWTCEAWSLVANNTASARTFTVDTTAPALTLSSPNKTYHVGLEGMNLTLNWTVNDTTIGLDSCWYDLHNGSNTTATCGNNGTTFIVLYPNTSLIFYANDTLNNIASEPISWDFLVWYHNETYDDDVLEKSTNEFLITTEMLAGYTITPYINYNNTQYSATETITGSYYRYSANVTAPDVTPAQNITFFWNFTFNNGSNTYVQTNSSNQTVRNISLDDCTTHSLVIYNFSLKDEIDQDMINTTIYNNTVEVDLDVYAVDEYTPFAQYSQNYSANNNPQVCFSVSLGNSSYIVDMQVFYDGDSYSPELYHIQRATITNDSITQNIDLFDLLDADAQKFLITYKDENFLPVANALIEMQRKYISEGAFKVIEIPKTDDQGQAIGYFDLDNAVYNILVTQNGTTIATFDNIAVACQDIVIGDCRINLNELDTSVPFTDWEELRNITYTMSFDPDDRNITLTFTSGDGSVRNVSLNVTKYDRFGNDSICTNSLNTASGSFICHIPASYGNVTAIAELYSDGEFVVRQLYSISPDIDHYFEGQAPLLILMMLFTIPLMFITSTIGLVIGGVFVFIMAFGLMILNVDNVIGLTSSIMWLIICACIIIWKMYKRRDDL